MPVVEMITGYCSMQLVNNKLVLKDSIKLGKKWPEKISPAGIEIHDAAKMMYVVTKENNHSMLLT